MREKKNVKLRIFFFKKCFFFSLFLRKNYFFLKFYKFLGVEQHCLIPPPPGFERSTVSGVQPSVTSIYAPQVIAPQVHAQFAAIPTTSFVHNVVCLCYLLNCFFFYFHFIFRPKKKK